MKVITISGKAEAGKDTVAIVLKENLELEGKKVLIIRYADYLKFTCREYQGWDGKKDEVGRALLQAEGTEFVRSIDFDFWAKIVTMYLKVYKSRYDYALVPDTRFPNEVQCIVDAGFPVFTVNVQRVGHESLLTEIQRNHLSETTMDNFCFDYNIISESGIDNLRIQVEKMLEDQEGVI